MKLSRYTSDVVDRLTLDLFMIEYSRDNAFIGALMLYMTLVTSCMAPLLGVYAEFINVPYQVAFVVPLFFLSMFGIVAWSEAIPEIMKKMNKSAY